MPISNQIEGQSALLSDDDIALHLSLSASWVRKQRWLRKRGDEHSLAIDPVHIGKTPRYRTEDFQAWLDDLQIGSVAQ
jgi:hypothetical protein